MRGFCVVMLMASLGCHSRLARGPRVHDGLTVGATVPAQATESIHTESGYPYNETDMLTAPSLDLRYGWGHSEARAVALEAWISAPIDVGLYAQMPRNRHVDYGFGVSTTGFAASVFGLVGRQLAPGLTVYTGHQLTHGLTKTDDVPTEQPMEVTYYRAYTGAVGVQVQLGGLRIEGYGNLVRGNSACIRGGLFYPKDCRLLPRDHLMVGGGVGWSF